jgi:predicted phosphodiesterase
LANSEVPKAKKPSMHAQALLSERTKKYDESATEEDCIADLRALQESQPDKFISRNFYRVYGAYSDATWNRYMGTFSQFRKSAKLELNRGQQRLEKHISRHAALDVYRQFHTAEVAPWIGKYERGARKTRIKTLVIGSDFHDKEADPFVLSVFIDTCVRLQPDVIVLNGDVFDQLEFSQYDKDPRAMDLVGRYTFVRDRIFKPLRQGCPTSQIDFIIGNHEHRLLRLLADKAPYFKVLADFVGITFSQLLMLDEFEINLVSKSDLSAYSPAETRKEVKKNYKKYFDTVICCHEPGEDYAMSSVSGHTHKPRLTTKANEVMGPIFALTTGSICRIDPEYHQEKINAQNSFAIIHIDTQERQAINEHITFTDSMAVVGGKYYFRS